MNRHRVAMLLSAWLLSCAPADKAVESPSTIETPPAVEEEAQAPADDFVYIAEQFADIRVLRYQVPGFAELPLQQKKLAYHLSQAALAGRDIIWDQNYRHNLLVRRTLEALWRDWTGDRKSDDWAALALYSKRVWFSNGIHHHYSMKKIAPEFSREFFETAVRSLPADKLPLAADELLATLGPVLFDPKVDAKKVNLDSKADLIASSATNYYGKGVTQKDVERFYAKKADKNDKHPPSHGLNSQLVKKKGKLQERVWKIDGMYGPAIAKIVESLEQAVLVAENDAQRRALELLVAYYRTGDLKTFDEYSIAWVADIGSVVDVVNGFIEVYGDPMGYRGAFESVVSIKDSEASKRIAAISKEAQWFEDHSPIPDEYKKKNVTGISAKVITVVTESGDSAPSTPIGINLPNANWIRAEHGSKSVNLGNIVRAYEASKKQSGELEEFAASEEEVARAKKWSGLGDVLHTDMHEVIGHASGQLREGVVGEELKNYSSTLEEARADLVALYYMLDPKLVELGVMPDLEVGKAAYDRYIRNGLVSQLARLEPGEDLEEAHMRNRQMIAKWAFEQGKGAKVIERVEKNGKTYFVVNDYEALRKLFGQLLREVQRIKSEGDFAAGKAMVEAHGVKVDKELHAQVRERYAALKIAPYAGFIQPRLVPVMEGEEIVDVRVEYPTDFAEQMLEFGAAYSFLPTTN